MRDALRTLQEEVSRLSDHNRDLSNSNENNASEAEQRFAQLQAEANYAHQQWKQSSQQLVALQHQHGQLSSQMETVVRQEIEAAVADKNTEIAHLRARLEHASQQIEALASRTASNDAASEFLTIRDEDFFEDACYQLSQHVQQWVVRFSKFSDTRAARLTQHVRDEKTQMRLRKAILDGSNVDAHLADRIRRRDVFMSVVMGMIWEFVFTRYLFGMDRDQRQKLKNLERVLLEVGESTLGHRW